MKIIKENVIVEKAKAILSVTKSAKERFGLLQLNRQQFSLLQVVRL